ncbi:MAG: Two component transcriptional regulator, LuxR family [Verrucomicrobiales bacterium]|nr:Two component transcriptional regulator, LuxR family [Verrucomicrobiales bacterium]
MSEVFSPAASRDLPHPSIMESQFMKKSVIVVEDHRGLREQIVQILDGAPDIKCLGAFGYAEDALPQIFEKNPDVVLMDIKLPGMSGIQCVSEIKKVMPAKQVIMVTVYEDSERIFRALKAGANGYLLKSSPPEQLLAAIRDVSTGGAPMSSHIANKVVAHFHLTNHAAQESENLSPREKEVLELLALGLIYKEIGDKLNIGTETVRTYVKNICQKMHVRSRLEAVARHKAEAF